MVVSKGNIDNNQLIQEIKSGNAKLLEQLYDENRSPFIIWASQRYQCEEDTAAEVYQKAFTVFYYNIREGKLTTLTSSMRTYLFSIGKNLFRERYRDKHLKLVQLEDHSSVSEENIDTSITDKHQQNHQKDMVAKLLNKVGEPCKTLLELIFLKGYSTDAVVQAMGYSDERVVRKRKCLCLKKLREMVQELGGAGI